MANPVPLKTEKKSWYDETDTADDESIPDWDAIDVPMVPPSPEAPIDKSIAILELGRQTITDSEIVEDREGIGHRNR